MIMNNSDVIKSLYLPYSPEQKHVLCTIQEIIILFFKVSITNMPHIVFRNKTFFVFKDRKLKFSASYWFGISWILTKFQLIRTTFIFRMGVTNRDVLLLATIRYIKSIGPLIWMFDSQNIYKPRLIMVRVW